MQRPKNELQKKILVKKFQEISPKFIAKTPINLRNRKLAGQSSAHPANRNHTKPYQYSKTNQHAYKLEDLHKQKNSLDQDQIKNSAIYKLLQKQISDLAERQQLEIIKLQQAKKEKTKDFEQIKKQQHSIKLQIWELKNEAMELKDSIQQEHNQTQRLMQQLGIQNQDQLDNSNEAINQQ